MKRRTLLELLFLWVLATLTTVSGVDLNKTTPATNSTTTETTTTTRTTTTTPQPSTAMTPATTTAPAEKICEEQMQAVENGTIIWPQTNTTTVSKPLCITENFEFVKRSCTEGKWEDVPNCFTIQKDVYPCPDNFQYIKNYNICYTILDPSPFNAKCPYANTLSFYDYEKILENITDDFYWMPLKRNDENSNIGVYTWIEPNYFYGIEEENNQITYDGTILDKPCVVFNNQKQLRTVSCDSKYPRICAYSTLDENTDMFCTDNFKHSECFQSDFDFTTCFCVDQQIEVCTKKAEFLLPYQNQLKNVFKNYSCWFGLEKNPDGFLWSTSKKALEYTFWANHTSFRHSHGAIGFDGWALYPQNTLKCFFCEHEFKLHKPFMNLLYNELNNEFVLLVQYHRSLRTLVTNLKKTKVLCFFHAGTDSVHVRFKILMNVYESDFQSLYTFLPVDFGPGYYWCEGFEYPLLERVVSNKIFLYDKKRFGNEHVGKATFVYREGINPLSQKFYVRIHSFLMSYMKNPPRLHQYFVTYLVSLRRFKITHLDEKNRKVQFLLHITTRSKSFDNVDDEFSSIRNLFVNAVEKINGTVEEFLSTNYCYRDTVYVENKTLTFSATPNGETAIPKELCFQEDGQPVTRKCEGDFISGARWSEVKGSCAKNVSKSEVTNDLNGLLENNLPVETIVENLTSISREYEKFSPIDVYLTGRILHKLSYHRNTSLENVTRIVCNTNNISPKILEKSQKALNATDNVLISYDSIIEHSDILENNTHYIFKTDNLALLVSDINRSNISGVALIEENNTIAMVVLNTTTTVENILQEENVKSAVFINPILIEQIRNASQFRYRQKLIITAFKSDGLFNENSAKDKWCEGVIFGVTIPNFKEEFLAPITVYVDKKENGNDYDTNNINRTCAHWEICTENCNTKSFWAQNSGNITSMNDTDFIACDFWHATHFALLIVDDFRKLNNGINLHILNVISAINCILSLAGLCCILLTCLLFRNWRNNAGNQVLVNFVLSLTMQIALLYISNAVSDKITDGVCILIGALLHYSVVSGFCWMLVIAVLQYKRLVTVFLKPIKNLLVKTCLVGWVLPFFPVFVLLYFSPENYTKNNIGTCYPTENGLYYGVLLPVGAIITVNFSIFCVILYNIFHTKTEKPDRYSYELIFQWRTIILLFFMLGLTWVFAILSYLESGLIFIYLFCFTATLQGFILFMFFIVFNKHTRLMYKNMIKRCYHRYY